MSDKYLIRNCPALYQINGMTNECLGTDYQCQDCTDCILKQIVELCNEYSGTWEDCDYSNGLSDEILELLEIEECESE